MGCRPDLDGHSGKESDVNELLPTAVTCRSEMRLLCGFSGGKIFLSGVECAEALGRSSQGSDSFARLVSGYPGA